MPFDYEIFPNASIELDELKNEVLQDSSDPSKGIKASKVELKEPSSSESVTLNELFSDENGSVVLKKENLQEDVRDTLNEVGTKLNQEQVDQSIDNKVDSRVRDQDNFLDDIDHKTQHFDTDGKIKDKASDIGLGELADKNKANLDDDVEDGSDFVRFSSDEQTKLIGVSDGATKAEVDETNNILRIDDQVTEIKTSQQVRNEITSQNLEDKVDENALKTDAVTSDKIANKAVVLDKLEDGVKSAVEDVPNKANRNLENIDGTGQSLIDNRASDRVTALRPDETYKNSEIVSNDLTGKVDDTSVKTGTKLNSAKNAFKENGDIIDDVTEIGFGALAGKNKANLDEDVDEGSTNKFYTTTEKDKLDGVSDGATKTEVDEINKTLKIDNEVTEIKTSQQVRDEITSQNLENKVDDDSVKTGTKLNSAKNAFKTDGNIIDDVTQIGFGALAGKNIVEISELDQGVTDILDEVPKKANKNLSNVEGTVIEDTIDSKVDSRALKPDLQTDSTFFDDIVDKTQGLDSDGKIDNTSVKGLGSLATESEISKNKLDSSLTQELDSKLNQNQVDGRVTTLRPDSTYKNSEIVSADLKDKVDTEALVKGAITTPNISQIDPSRIVRDTESPSGFVGLSKKDDGVVADDQYTEDVIQRYFDADLLSPMSSGNEGKLFFRVPSEKVLISVEEYLDFSDPSVRKLKDNVDVSENNLDQSAQDFIKNEAKEEVDTLFVDDSRAMLKNEFGVQEGGDSGTLSSKIQNLSNSGEIVGGENVIVDDNTKTSLAEYLSVDQNDNATFKNTVRVEENGDQGTLSKKISSLTEEGKYSRSGTFNNEEVNFTVDDGVVFFKSLNQVIRITQIPAIGGGSLGIEMGDMEEPSDPFEDPDPLGTIDTKFTAGSGFLDVRINEDNFLSFDFTNGFRVRGANTSVDNISVGGSFFSEFVVLDELSGQEDELQIPEGKSFTITASAFTTPNEIRGIVPTENGRYISLTNSGSESFEIIHEGATDTQNINNRIIIAGKNNITLEEDETVHLQYDHHINRWRVVSLMKSIV